jgi:hypothetical protein
MSRGLIGDQRGVPGFTSVQVPEALNSLQNQARLILEVWKFLGNFSFFVERGSNSERNDWGRFIRYGNGIFGGNKEKELKENIIN